MIGGGELYSSVNNNNQQQQQQHDKASFKQATVQINW